MNQSTIDRIKAMIAQNNQMNADLTEILTLAEQGWKTDQETIASEVSKQVEAIKSKTPEEVITP